MGGNIQSRVKCPRCGEQGILRLKQKRKNAIIVSHYDKEKYQKGTKGTRSCYIASMDIPTFKIFDKFFSGKDRYDEYDHFSKIWRNFKSRYQHEGILKDIKPTSEGLEKFVSILDELRKIRIIEDTEKRVQRQELVWSIRCPKCRTGIEIDVIFHGVYDRRPVELYSEPKAHIHFKTTDASRDIIWSPFFHIFQPFPVVSSL